MSSENPLCSCDMCSGHLHRPYINSKCCLTGLLNGAKYFKVLLKSLLVVSLLYNVYFGQLLLLLHDIHKKKLKNMHYILNGLQVRYCVWTPGRVDAAFTAANGDPLYIQI